MFCGSLVSKAHTRRTLEDLLILGIRAVGKASYVCSLYLIYKFETGEFAIFFTHTLYSQNLLNETRVRITIPQTHIINRTNSPLLQRKYRANIVSIVIAP